MATLWIFAGYKGKRAAGCCVRSFIFSERLSDVPTSGRQSRSLAPVHGGDNILTRLCRLRLQPPSRSCRRTRSALPCLGPLRPPLFIIQRRPTDAGFHSCPLPCMSSSLSRSWEIKMPLSSRTSVQAREAIQRAYKELESAVSVTDASRFRETTIQDVQKTCRIIENELGARGLLRNMGRLEPLLKGLECYGKVVETLCQGTPFLPWIWAPIVTILKVSAPMHVQCGTFSSSI